MNEAELIFPETWQLDGFTTNVTSRQAGEPDPVIRELLQNCLDAAIREAGRERAEVHFTIGSCPLTDLPGDQAYKKAFRAAQSELKQPTTHDVRSAVERIDRVLEQGRTSVLYCRDNGIGLDAVRMKALLSEGQSDKATHGAGSYGLGHLTAYAASDLRYVLYAGKRGQHEIASGHAILASHKHGNTRYSAHGFWRTPTDVFSLEDSNYPNAVPPLLRDQVDKITDSGTVVAIAGFNHFHDDDRSQALDDICRVAALNFLGAIWDQKMVVHVHDEDSGRTERVDASSLESMLLPTSKQQRAPSKGWLAGSQGYRALQTLQAGRWLDDPIDRSIRVRFRSLGAGASDRSRVQIFRDGMWITNVAPRLDTGAFGGVYAFDAVVLLSDANPEDHTEFYDLVRNSEGPEHRDLTKFRELSKRKRAGLTEMLDRLADRLRAEAGKMSDSSGFTPTGFAVFDGDVQRHARAIPGIRQRSRGKKKSMTRKGGTKPGKRVKKRTQRDITPASAVAFQSSAKPVLDTRGSAVAITGEVKVNDEISANETLYLRVYIDSGSDASCDYPIQSHDVSIAAAKINGVDALHGGREIVVPANVTNVEVTLGRPIADPALVSLELVRRAKHSAEKAEAS